MGRIVGIFQERSTDREQTKASRKTSIRKQSGLP